MQTSPLVRMTESSSCTSFSILNPFKNRLAIAELSLVYHHTIYEHITDGLTPHESNRPWYYFNRINIPVRFEPQNAAILLYIAIANWADEKQVNIINDISTYGNLTSEQIYTVEHLFGFNKINMLYEDGSILTTRIAR